MSSAFVSPPFMDVGDAIRQNMLMQQQQQLQSAERRNTIGAPVNIPRNRNFSVGNYTTSTPTMIPVDNNQNGLSEHKKLDRFFSEPCDRTTLNNNNNTNLNNQPKQQAVNSSRYKTELCRPYEESGHCKYADKCQFAHGMHELKNLQRHPKYKTELCRTFHSKGFCPYGPRCNFIHNDEVGMVGTVNDKNNRITGQQQQQTMQATQQQQYFQHICPPGLSQSPPPPVQRPTSINFNNSFNGSLGSSAESSPPSSVSSESPSLSPVFFNDELLCNSGLNNTLNFDNSTNGKVFSVVPELSNLDLSPLNIQTQLNTEGLMQQFSALMLNLNNPTNCHGNKVEFEEWDNNMVSSAPPSSPDSISGESVASSSSFATNNTVSVCGSPMESGKNFRLPVFNHISQD